MIVESFSSYGEPCMTKWQVIRWWEIRRIVFNATLFVIGLASLLAMEGFFDKFIPPGEDGIEPMVLAFAVLVYGIAANICYTFGWIVELIGRRNNVERARMRAERSFLVGLLFSGLVTTAPFWFGLISWLQNRNH